MEISAECKVKGQLPHLEGGDGKKKNGRQILESPRGVWDSPTMSRHFPKGLSGPWCDTCINHQEPPCPTLFLPSRRNRCRGKFGEGRTGDPTTLGPSSGYQHSHWFPRGEWPTWLRPGKWQKWAMQLFINIWHYLQWLFTDMYIHHLSTHSCTKCIEMRWELFPLLTNLLISFHQQSSVLLHQGTSFKEPNV